MRYRMPIFVYSLIETGYSITFLIVNSVCTFLENNTTCNTIAIIIKSYKM